MLLRVISKCALTSSRLQFHVRTLRHYHRERISTFFQKPHFRKLSYDENEQEIDDNVNDTEHFDQLVMKSLPSINLQDPVMVRFNFKIIYKIF